MGLEGISCSASIHLLCIHLNCFFLMITSVTPRCHCLQASHWTELVARGKWLWSWLYSLHSELCVSYQEARMVLNQWIILLSLNGRCWKQFQHRDHVLSPREKVHMQNFLWNYRAKVYFIFALSFFLVRTGLKFKSHTNSFWFCHVSTGTRKYEQIFLSFC